MQTTELLKKLPKFGSYQYSAMADDLGLGTNVSATFHAYP